MEAVARHTVILGSGLSGLATAWHVARRFPQRTVTVLEASGRPGGWVETTATDEFIFDRGPHSIRPGKLNYAMCELVSQLGLDNQIVLGDPQAKYRYLYHSGSLKQLPSSLRDVVSQPGVFGRGLISALRKEYRSKQKCKDDDESVYDFVKRRFGSEVADTLITAMVHGIYAGDAKTLSVRACFPVLYNAELGAGSVVKGMLKREAPPDVSAYDTNTQHLYSKVKGSGMWSFQQGMGTLTTSLANALDKLPNVQLMYNSPCTKLSLGDRSAETTLANDQTIQSAHVISTIAAPLLAEILHFQTDARSGAKRISSILQSIPFGSVGVVNVGYREPVLPLKGFGYLVPSGQHVPELGVIFDSCAFPAQDSAPGHQRLTVMLGGHKFQEVFGCGPDSLSSDVLKATALDVLQNRLGITTAPAVCLARVQKNCIPQYPLGHIDRMKELDWLLRNSLQGRLSVLGCSYLGVSVNDMVRYARHLAHRMPTTQGTPYPTGLAWGSII